MQEKGQKISPIKQRILQFADTLGVSKRDFYAQIGVSRGTLESNTGITEDIVAKFIAVFPKISLDWLIIGQGPMLRDEYPPATSVVQHDPNDLQRIKDLERHIATLEKLADAKDNEIRRCEESKADKDRLIAKLEGENNRLRYTSKSGSAFQVGLGNAPVDEQ